MNSFNLLLYNFWIKLLWVYKRDNVSKSKFILSIFFFLGKFFFFIKPFSLPRSKFYQIYAEIRFLIIAALQWRIQSLNNKHFTVYGGQNKRCILISRGFYFAFCVCSFFFFIIFVSFSCCFFIFQRRWIVLLFYRSGVAALLANWKIFTLSFKLFSHKFDHQMFQFNFFD